MSKKSILITGATGFVGANLVRRLINGKNEVNIILRKTSDTWRIDDVKEKLNAHYVDLNNFKELNKVVNKIKPQVIYHLATYGAYPFQKDTDKIFKINVLGTNNLLNSCAELGFKAFINVGSSSEYGVKSKPMLENNLLEPDSYYGVAKASQTLLCQCLAKNKNLPIVTLRLFSPYGPYEASTRLVPVLINSCFDGKDLNLVSKKTVRDFNFIDDVVDAFLKTASNANKLSGEILNIANGRQRTLEEVVSLIINLTKSKSKLNWGGIKDYSPEAGIWEADISKTKKFLNWSPSYNLESGIKETIIWFKKNRVKYKDKYVIR